MLKIGEVVNDNCLVNFDINDETQTIEESKIKGGNSINPKQIINDNKELEQQNI